MGGAQSEETGDANVTESADQGVEGNAQANRTEPVTSLQVHSLLYLAITLDFSCCNHCLPPVNCLRIIIVAVYAAGTE